MNQELEIEGLIKSFKIDSLSEGWKPTIYRELKKDYFVRLLNTVDKDYRCCTLYPDQGKVFEALKTLSPEEIRVVIIGQDPYHGPGQANGLAFSVNEGIPAPPSLVNIFKELFNEYGAKRTRTNLSDWAEQGVLLLNAVLTVKAGQASSHSNIGWEEFTDSIIRELNNKRKPIVFILWGNYAIAKGKNINKENHLVLTSPHPSPLSSYRGFFGNGHFKKANEFLEKNNREKIKWI